MPFVANFPFFCIMITIAGGVTSSILSGKNAYRLNVLISTACFVMSGALLLFMVQNPQAITFLMGHFPAPWGNEIRFGPLEALIATTVCFVMLMMTLSEKERVFQHVKSKKINLFYIMLNLLLASTLALIYTNDLFTAYVFIEINTLCACGLVMSKETGKTIAATIKYLIMSLLGSGLFLLSIILIYDLTGHLLMPNIQESMALLMHNEAYQLPITIIIGLLAVSLAIKSALFPFHTWMPNAYNRAMNISNALSSSIVMKGYIILLIKIFYRTMGIDLIQQLNVSNILFVFGLFAMIVSSFDAMRTDNIKKMLAYSSIAQIGYIYVGIGLNTTEGFVAACFIIVAHSLTKSMLFSACEGLMIVSDHSKHIKNLRGSGYRNPIAGIAFAIGAFSMIGFPLLSGFSGKFLLATAGLHNPDKMWFVLIALAFSTLLNAIYFTKVITVIYTKDDTRVASTTISFQYKFALTAFIIVNLLLTPYTQLITDIITSGIAVL